MSVSEPQKKPTAEEFKDAEGLLAQIIESGYRATPEDRERSRKLNIKVGKAGIELDNLHDVELYAEEVFNSGTAPKSFIEFKQGETKDDHRKRCVAALTVALLMGRELGFTPIQSLRSIAVINGKPGLYGEAALALCFKAPCFDVSKFTEGFEGKDDDYGAFTVTCRNGGIPKKTTFTLRDAKRASLWGKAGPWTGYPQRMLMFRARGFNLRDNFGDVLLGLKTVEEIQDEDGGAILDAAVAQADAPSKPLADRIAPVKKVKPKENGKAVEAPTSAPVAARLPGSDAEAAKRVFAVSQSPDIQAGAKGQGLSANSMPEVQPPAPVARVESDPPTVDVEGEPEPAKGTPLSPEQGKTIIELAEQTGLDDFVWREHMQIQSLADFSAEEFDLDCLRLKVLAAMVKRTGGKIGDRVEREGRQLVECGEVELKMWLKECQEPVRPVGTDQPVRGRGRPVGSKNKPKDGQPSLIQ